MLAIASSALESVATRRYLVIMAVAWSALGLLAASQLGMFFYLGNRIDNLGNRLDAKIDAMGARLEGRIDALSARIDAQTARIDSHLERHPR